MTNLEIEVEQNRSRLDSISIQQRARIMELLQRDEARTDVWLISVCGFLDGRRPIDVLLHDENLVLDAARDAGQGVQHG